MIRTGLDRLLERGEALAGRRWALLAHAASVSADLVPAHLALERAGAGRPALLLAPEHGYWGVEQDMVAAAGGADPWTGTPVVSLYGCDAASLRPAPETFAGLDLLLVDLQDVGARYYTYAATAAWAAEAAATAGCAVWVLDRPNPLGGVEVEGNLRDEGLESFVGAFAVPVRHGLTLGELLTREARRRGWEEALEVWTVTGWRRETTWPETGRPWIAPSPNLPSVGAVQLYPGLCLVEATELSEGRGTTRPFRLVGAPGLDPLALTRELAGRRLPGVAFLPTYFRPQYQKHQGEVCGGVELVVTDAARLRPYRLGVELLTGLKRAAGDRFAWRRQPYEFVAEFPAIDLLAGSPALRTALERDQEPAEWIATWPADEEAFRAARREWLLYPEPAA